jgi:hypothetical protein
LPGGVRRQGQALIADDHSTAFILQDVRRAREIVDHHYTGRLIDFAGVRTTAEVDPFLVGLEVITPVWCRSPPGARWSRPSAGSSTAVSPARPGEHLAGRQPARLRSDENDLYLIAFGLTGAPVAYRGRAARFAGDGVGDQDYPNGQVAGCIEK